jgi:hypothetical protein
MIQIKRVLILLLWILVGSLFTKMAVDASSRVEEGRCKAGNVSYCKETPNAPNGKL